MQQSSLISDIPGVRHGFMTRRGGVSDGIYGSLNCGNGSKDNPDAVRENRRIVAELLGVGPGHLITPYQYHSAQTVLTDSPWTPDLAPKADAVVTTTPGLLIGISTADCTPVLFCDDDGKVVAAAHAGWRGALAGVLEATVARMVEAGADQSRINAAIGPCISKVNYEVGPEFKAEFISNNAEFAAFFHQKPDQERPFFDLPGFIEFRLSQCKIGHINKLDICTYGNESDFFSYRRATHLGESDYGRQISAIVLD